jgi:hypothetical protein
MAQTFDLSGPVVRGAARFQEHGRGRALGEKRVSWLRESRRRSQTRPDSRETATSKTFLDSSTAMVVGDSRTPPSGS